MNRIAFTVILLLAGCATTHRGNTPNGRTPTALSPLHKIELDYIRGENLHRLVAIEEADRSGIVEFFNDTKLTKQTRIDHKKYNQLAKQADEIISSFRVENRDTADCRTPFVIKITRDRKTKAVEGCRNDDKAALLGKFIREAERLSLTK